MDGGGTNSLVGRFKKILLAHDVYFHNKIQKYWVVLSWLSCILGLHRVLSEPSSETPDSNIRHSLRLHGCNRSESGSFSCTCFGRHRARAAHIEPRTRSMSRTPCTHRR